MNNFFSSYDTCLVGYYGMKNSGDDALLAASIWGAERYLGSKKIVATTPTTLALKGHNKLLPTLSKTQRYRGQRRIQHYAQALKSRRIIFGGGSVFHTAQDINIKRHMMCLSRSDDHRAVGVGLGPFADAAAERACKEFLNECSYVGLRDRESFAIASNLAPNANVELTFDLAPLLLRNRANNLAAIPRKGIAVCLCPKERLHGDMQTERRRITLLAQALINAYGASGEPIYLINFNGHERFGDASVHRELRQLLSAKVPVRTIDYDPNPMRVLQRLSGFKAVVSMRLHGSILAYLANTPVLSLNYHSKCNGWCDQVGMPNELRFDASAIDPTVLADTLINGLDDYFCQNRLTVDSAIKAAEKNWRK